MGRAPTTEPPLSPMTPSNGSVPSVGSVDRKADGALVAALELGREQRLELVELADELLDGALEDDLGLGLALGADEHLRHRQAGVLDDVLREVDVLVGEERL